MQRFKRNRKSLSWLIGLLFWANLASSQDLFFKTSNIIDEESEIIINDFVKDDRGLLWFASNEGLLFSDGDGYSRISIVDSIESKEIKTLYYHDGHLYLGWSSGYISTFSIEFEKIVAYQYVESNAISKIVLDGEENIWIGTKDKGLILIRDENMLFIDVNFGLADNVVNDILYDNEKECIWVATDRGLSKCTINPKLEIENLTGKDGLPDNLLTSLELDQENNLWMGSYSGKLTTLSKEEKLEVVESGINVQILDIESIDYEMYIAHSNGLLVIDLKDSRPLLEINSIKGVKQIKNTAERQLMLLSNANDLSISDNNIRYYKNFQQLEFSNTSVIYTTSKGDLLIANSEYILRKLNNDSIEILLDLKKENIAYVISLLEDQYGSIWFGTFDHGLYRFKNGLIENYSEKDGLINNNVMTIYEWKNAIWCGTLGGLSKVSNQDNELQFVNFSMADGLDASYIYQIRAFNDKLYIASDGEGLFTYDQKTFRKIESLSSRSIYDIQIQDNHHLYLSCDHGEIIELKDNKEVKVYTILNKDRTIDLAGIHQLDSNILLFTWEQGFGLLNSLSGDYKLYNAEWGLDGFQNDFLNVLTQDGKGNIWIGGNKYIIKILESIKEEALHPKSIIRSIELFSAPFDTSLHHFNYQQNHFSFNVNSIWLQDHKHIEYQYRLVGLDNEWLNTKDNLIVYPRLNPGKYRFELRSGTSQTIDNASIIHYSFEINKAFYTTWWFFVIIVLIFLIGVYGLIIYRDKKAILKKRMDYERVLSQFELLKSQINPHFLFNSLNTAYALIGKDTEDARKYLLNLSNYLRSILTKNQDHVIHLSKELDFAENYILLQKKRFGENLLFDININDESIIESFIPPLTLQILIENAIKHNVISKTNPLRTSIYVEAEYLVVENNLQIKKRTGEGTKIGLSNIKSRYKILFDKEIIIDISKDAFIVKLPIIYSYVESITD
jgi:ligand-binding sensor domain-containing protein